MKNRFLMASLAVAALLVAACGGGGATTAPQSVAPPAATTAPVGTNAPAPTGGASAGATVDLASTDLGEILVDGQGMTLYGFLPDEETGEPTCYDECASNWPPLIVSDEVTVGDGLDDSSFTTATRTDDSGDQVVIGSWPLYYFAGDTAAGDVNGQGVGDNWFVVDANGELILE